MSTERPPHVDNIAALEMDAILNGTDQNSLWAIKESLDKVAADKETADLKSISRSLYTLDACLSVTSIPYVVDSHRHVRKRSRLRYGREPPNAFCFEQS